MRLGVTCFDFLQTCFRSSYRYDIDITSRYPMFCFEGVRLSSLLLKKTRRMQPFMQNMNLTDTGRTFGGLQPDPSLTCSSLTASLHLYH